MEKHRLPSQTTAHSAPSIRGFHSFITSTVGHPFPASISRIHLISLVRFSFLSASPRAYSVSFIPYL
ncbi:hypothetical protein BDR04DRAFT_812286 [Suillus decipiens]|nr:hypothetical protein BDR04DRAFT_812286 [Suillus decipiens]